MSHADDAPVPQAGRSRLGAWLERKLRENNWTQRQAESHTGIKRSTISFIIRAPESHQHDWGTLIDIARAFDEPVWLILEMAGVPLDLPNTTNSVLQRLQSLAEHQPEYQELLGLLGEMEQEDVHAVLSLLVGARRRREAAKSTRPPTPDAKVP